LYHDKMCDHTGFCKLWVLRSVGMEVYVSVFGIGGDVNNVALVYRAIQKQSEKNNGLLTADD